MVDIGVLKVLRIAFLHPKIGNPWGKRNNKSCQRFQPTHLIVGTLYKGWRHDKNQGNQEEFSQDQKTVASVIPIPIHTDLIKKKPK
jgi:hypothetical protein